MKRNKSPPTPGWVVDYSAARAHAIRWLGDRYGIEKVTKTWEKVIVDRTREMRAWIPAVREILARNRTVFGFFNNHYAGHAPASIELFEKLWAEG